MLKRITLLLLIIQFICWRAGAQGFLRTEGIKIVNDKGENILLRGIGLGGWMLQEGYMLKVNGDGQQYRFRERMEDLIGKQKTDEFYDMWLANHTTKQDVDSLKAWGFNSVRLPMHYKLYAPGGNGFAITDSLLSWCRANKMYLILDLHAAPGGQGSDLNIADRDSSKPSLWQNEADYNNTVALWKKIAYRYKNEPWIGAYDILNEPNWGFDDHKNDKYGLKEQHNVPLKKLLQDITAAIREVDSSHIIIIEGNAWGNNYRGMLPQWDSNMVLSFHKYWNYNNEQSIQQIIEFRKRYNIPVWIGETGENSNVWFAEAIRLFEKHNIGWSWWPLKKLGINNPLEVPLNEGYRNILDYWLGKRQRPTDTEAYNAFMDLAMSTNISRNVIHRDVLDAMFRQPFSLKAIPFLPNMIKDQTTLLAVDYDLGVNGAAYYDTDSANYKNSTKNMLVGNRGGKYRNDGVDIFEGNEIYQGYYVADIKPGEWLQYTIDVKEEGLYDIGLLTRNTGKLSVIAGKDSVLVELADASGKLSYAPAGSVRLFKGPQPVKIFSITGGFELMELAFKRRKR